MSAQLHIHQLKTRYRLSPQTDHSRSRLDRVLREVMDQALDIAMDELGIAESEELCIRELHSLVHLPLQQSDSQMAMQWSRALASAIQQSLSATDTKQVVRFASRLHALTDFTHGVANKRLQRAWAWRQLGFIDDETVLTLQSATQQLVDILQVESKLIIPLFTGIARDDRFLLLVERLQAEQWLSLSQALAGTLIPQTKLLSVVQSVDHQRPTQNDLQKAGSQLQKSHIAQTLLAHPQEFLQAEVPLSAMMVFIAAELDCAVFSRSQNWLTEWLILLGHAAVNSQPALMALAGDWLPEMSSQSELLQTQDEQASNAEGEFSNTPSQLNKNLKSPSSAEITEIVETENVDELGSDLPQWEQPELMKIDQGGVFLLYGLMDQLALPQRMMNDPVLSERPFGWLLYHFARIVIPEEDQASCLLFAGAMPDEPILWEEESDPSEAEQDALQHHVESLTDSLLQRLQWQDEVPAMLEWVCYRPAVLYIDPGWLRVTFSLDAVDTSIRKAMLDLNPGYLAWLGRVVEFVYE